MPVYNSVRNPCKKTSQLEIITEKPRYQDTMGCATCHFREEEARFDACVRCESRFHAYSEERYIARMVLEIFVVVVVIDAVQLVNQRRREWIAGQGYGKQG